MGSGIVALHPPRAARLPVVDVEEKLEFHGGVCKVYFNEYQVYRFAVQDLDRGLIRALVVMQELRAHPVDLSSRARIDEQMVERFIFYRDEPAVVEQFLGESGEVLIHAATEDRKFSIPKHLRDSGMLFPDNEREYRIKEDILSPHIWWFRTPTE